MQIRKWREPDPTVGEYLRHWLYLKVALKPSTRRSYADHIERYLIPHLGHLRIRSVSPSQIASMYELFAEKGAISTTTIRRIHSTLLAALNAAHARGVLAANPARLVELPRTTPPELQVWSSVELARFLDDIRGDPLFPILTLLALSGLRRGEAVALRIRDVDLERGLVRIVRSATKVGGDVIVGDLKTRSSRRTVALDRRTEDVLRQHMARLRAHGHGSLPDDVLFCGPLGDVLDPSSVSRHFDRLVKRSGLPRIRLHDLRHTSASIGLEAGESLLEVSRRLGHSSITVTADVYSHVAPHVSHAAAGRVADLVYTRQPQQEGAE